MKLKNIYSFIIIILLTTCTSTEIQKDITKKDINPFFIKYPQFSKQIKTTYLNMSDKERLAQLLIIRVRLPNGQYATKMTDTLFTYLKDLQIGGVILFSKNITNITQTKQLIKDIQKTSSIPPFISVDVEGGSVNRFRHLQLKKQKSKPSTQNKNNLFTLQAASAIASTLNPQQTEDFMYSIGQTLFSIGINMNFAPVADVKHKNTASFLQKRIYSDNVELTTQYVKASIRGLQKANIIAVAKHFPGHGAASTDTHKKLAQINIDKDTFYKKDFIPFQGAINENVPAIMMGHLFVPSLDKNAAMAELSPKVISILRNEMNFDGLIISDSLTMKAIRHKSIGPQLEERMINAGVTMLLDPAMPQKLLEKLKESLKNNKLSQDAIEQAVLLILHTKKSKLIY